MATDIHRIGDMTTLFAARTKVRSQFEENRALDTGSKELTEQIAHAEEVAKFLKENVVQGQATDAEGNYSMSGCFSAIPSFIVANATCQSSGYTSTPSVEIMRISRKVKERHWQGQNAARPELLTNPIENYDTHASHTNAVSHDITQCTISCPQD